MPFTINDGILISLSNLSYGDISGGDDYFSRRLNTTVWDTASDADKQKALYQATRSIDRLNFSKNKTVAGQYLQFPRGTDVNVPDDVENAAYEEALQLLSDIDSEFEWRQSNIVKHKFGVVETTYDRSTPLDNIQAGIMSATAWSLLFPFLRDPREVKIMRVS